MRGRSDHNAHRSVLHVDACSHLEPSAPLFSRAEPAAAYAPSGRQRAPRLTVRRACGCAPPPRMGGLSTDPTASSRWVKREIHASGLTVQSATANRKAHLDGED